MDRKDFDFDFDFEKEFGFDPKTLEGPEYDGELDIDLLDFDLNDPIFAEEPAASSDTDPEVPQEEDAPAEAPAIPEPAEEAFPPDGLSIEDFDMEAFNMEELTLEDDADDQVLDDMTLDLDRPDEEDSEDDLDEDDQPAPAEPQEEAIPEYEDISLDDLLLGQDFTAEEDIADDDLLTFGEETNEETAAAEDDEELLIFGQEVVAEEYNPEEELPLFDEEPSAENAEEEAAPAAEEEDVPQESVPEAPAPTPEDRRESRKERRQRIRKFKEEKLPMIIAAVAAGFILFFTFGAVIRGVINKAADDKTQAGIDASNQSAAQKLDEEAQRLLNEAAALAAGYDYEAAIAKLDSFSGEQSAYSEMVAKRSAYNQAYSQLVAWTDPSKIPNLSFHVLISDPGRAFTNASLGKKYNQNFVTIDEFSKILQQLYDNGYVLVSTNDVFVENASQSGAIIYAPGTIYLPADKKPVMITETLVNYLAYMIDSDNDGEADKGGAGFASRLVVKNGQIKAELVTSTGETIVGDYDLVPILESFISEHPDFSYRGARALLAVCGHEGVFGYRTNKGVINTKGQAYYDEQVSGAKEVVAALKASGYELACYTYENIPYGNSDATKIKNDLTKWSEEVKPILGDVNILIYAQNSEIDDYTGSKYNVVYSSGFRYFLNSANSPWTEISTNYVRQSRLMVTGTNMAYYSNMFSSYFNASAVMNPARGTVPN